MIDLKQLFSSPTEFFRSIENEKGYTKPLLYFAISSIIIQLITFPFNFIGVGDLGLSNVLIIASAFFNLFMGIGFAFLLPFVSAAFVYAGFFVLRVKADFLQVFKVVSYTGVIGLFYYFLATIISGAYVLISGVNFMDESFIFSLGFWLFAAVIMTIYFFGTIHALLAEVFGLALYHRVSKIKSFFAIVIVPFLLVLLSIIMLFGFIFVALLLSIS